MSNNSRINEISDNVFSTNSKLLENKTPKQINEQKKEFEYELEKELADLDNDQREKILVRLSKDSEEGKISFFDNNGNINITKVKSVVTNKIKEIKQEEKKIKQAETQENTSFRPDNQLEKIEVSREAKEEVNKLIENYSNLSTDEEKNEFIRKIFGKNRDIKKEEFDVYKTQLDLASLVKKLKEEGKSVSEIQKIVDSNEEFKVLTDEQRKINDDGYTLIETQLQLKEDINRLENDQKNLKNKIKDPNISETEKKDAIKKLKELEETLERGKKEEKRISEKTSVVKLNEKEVATEKFVEEREREEAEYFETHEKEPKANESHVEITLDLEGIKTPKDLKQLLAQGISKEDLEQAINTFNNALFNVEEGASKDEFQDMIKEMQEGATPETIAVLGLLSSMEFDKSIDKILNSDEDKENIVNQLSETLEQIQEFGLEAQTSEYQELITDAEFEAFSPEFVEIEVGEVPELEIESEELKSTKPEHESVITISPKFFELGSVINKASATRYGKIENVQAGLKELISSRGQDKEAVTVGIE